MDNELRNRLASLSDRKGTLNNSKSILDRFRYWERNQLALRISGGFMINDYALIFCTGFKVIRLPLTWVSVVLCD